MNYLKPLRLLSIVPLLASFVYVNLVQAAGSPMFNNLVGDQEFLQGRNVTQGTGFTDPVRANANEEVEVAVYYHNTVVDSTATNTTIKITLPSQSATSHVVKGTLSADNVTAVSGTMVNGLEVGLPDLTINSDGLTKLAFEPGTVRWFPNDPKSTVGPGANLPNGQNGDSIITTGINLGSIQGCFQFSGFVLFKVKLTGENLPVPKTQLSIVKEVRKAPSNDQFISRLTANPGSQVEYRITVRNLDGQIDAKDVRVQDALESGLTYVGPTIIHFSNGTAATLPDGITSATGIVVMADLKPLDSFSLTFVAATSSAMKNDDCLDNTALVSSPSASNSPQSTATVCFLVIRPTPTPTPTPTPPPTSYPSPTPTPVPPTPTPQPLPRTGAADLNFLLTAGISGAGVASTRYYYLKNKLKKIWRNLDIL